MSEDISRVILALSSAAMSVVCVVAAHRLRRVVQASWGPHLLWLAFCAAVFSVGALQLVEGFPRWPYFVETLNASAALVIAGAALFVARVVDDRTRI